MPHGASEISQAAFDRDCALAKIACGDRNALKCLHHDVAPQIFGVLLRIVRERQAAEDLLQETFVTIWTKAHLFDAERGSADAWLFAIARRKAIDRIRRFGREPVTFVEDFDVNHVNIASTPSTPDPETGMTIRRCLAGLGPNIRKALILSFAYGLTHEELAATMHVPLGTAKTWIRRGIAELRTAVGGGNHPFLPARSIAAGVQSQGEHVSCLDLAKR